jgi:hypothetical protein
MMSISKKPPAIEVLHLCEDARQLSDLLDLQATANIRPYLLTNPRSGSRWWWMRAWSDVREWRKLLSGFHVPLVHAHTFASGMAAVRGDAPVVYGLDTFVDHYLTDDSGKWMDRSFRAAEQFVLAQAEAIIVPTAAMRHAVLSRDVAKQKVFWVPDAIAYGFSERDEWLRQTFDVPANELTVFCATANTAVLHAIAECLKSAVGMRFFLRASHVLHSRPMMIPLLDDRDLIAAMRSADIVIAGDELSAVAAMRHGAALLLADTLYLRDLAPQHGGCMWFRSGEELSCKLKMLSAEPEVRRKHAEAGRKYILAERSPEAITRAYLAAYRYALEHRRSTGQPSDLSGSLVPVHAA